MELFKYLPPDRIDVLKSLRIRFTQPIAFNDPFESRPHIVYDISKEDMRDVMKIEMERINMSEDQREYFRHLHETGEFETRWPEALSPLVEIMASTTLALSLSEKPDSLLMWAHYTKSHEGFIIGFDSGHSFFKGKGRGIFRLLKVLYSNKRPNVGLSKLSLIDTYFTKSTDWEYEQEWRLFADVNDASEILGPAKLPICLFDIPADAISEVILGSRSNNCFKNEVSDILGCKNLRHVKLKQAEIDEFEYKLKILD